MPEYLSVASRTVFNATLFGGFVVLGALIPYGLERISFAIHCRKRKAEGWICPTWEDWRNRQQANSSRIPGDW